MSFARYPAYKDSGVEWLGEVPGHWEVKSLKHLVSMRNGEQITSDDIEETGEYAVFGGNGHRGFTDNFTHDGNYALIGRQGALCGNINYATGKFWASEHAVVVTPRQDCKVVWLGELLRAMNLGQYSITAAQPGLSVEAIGNLRVPVPPKEEQQAIATFLDIETAKIDGLMAEQRALVALLKEKRQAVISHAVTKGLNPAAPMKDSGVAWLGEVPEHWEVKRLKYNLRLLTEKTNRREQAIALENIESWTGKYIPTETEFEGDGVAFCKGDILFGKLRPYLAKAYLAEFSGEAVGDFHVLRPNESTSGRFVQYQILNREFIDLVDGSTFGSKMPRASWEFLSGIALATPPTEEQLAITAFLDDQTTQLDTLTQEAQTAIALLQERRTALISAAVTGQMDVRAAVAA